MFKKKGDVTFQFPIGEVKKIEDVFYILNLHKFFIFVGSLIDKDLIAIFNVSECLLLNKQGVVVIKGVKKINGLYKLETTIEESETCCAKNLQHIVLMGEVSDMVDDLWHKQLAHLNHRGVHYFCINSLAIKLPILPFLQIICEGCELGIQHRERTPRSISFCSNVILDLIHFNVCEPLQVPSFGLSHSLMILVVTLSVFFLQQNSEVFSAFMKFKSIVETITSRKIKLFQSD
jgi:hypothetical protein